ALLGKRRRGLVMDQAIIDECDHRALLLAQQRLAAPGGDVFKTRAAAIGGQQPGALPVNVTIIRAPPSLVLRGGHRQRLVQVPRRQTLLPQPIRLVMARAQRFDIGPAERRGLEFTGRTTASCHWTYLSSRLCFDKQVGQGRTRTWEGA